MVRTTVALGILSVFLSSCSAPQAPPPPDPRVLLRTGRYGEALDEAERRVREGEADVRALALLATARAANAYDQAELDSAIDALTRAVAASSRGQAAQAFSAEVTGSMAFERERFTPASRTMMSIAEVWDAIPAEAPARRSRDARESAAAMLSLAAYGAEHHASVDATAPLVHAAVSLLETATDNYVFPRGEESLAWECFRAAGALAAALGRDSELSVATAELAIRIAESNQSLAIPIMCDLSSPRDRLREVLRQRHDAASLRRLSAAMASAEGCSLGTYAP